MTFPAVTGALDRGRAELVVAAAALLAVGGRAVWVVERVPGPREQKTARS